MEQNSYNNKSISSRIQHPCEIRGKEQAAKSMWGHSSSLEEGRSLQEDLDKVEYWAEMNETKSNNDTGQVLP